MVTHCPLSERELEKVCCFDSVNVDCHIPWAGLVQPIAVFTGEIPTYHLF